MSSFTHLVAVATPSNIPKVNLDGAHLGQLFGGTLAIAGAICVLFIVLSAINYILSNGDAAKIKKAKDGILYAAIGLIIVGVSFLIVQLVVGIF